jgi:hypothetical protein
MYEFCANVGKCSIAQDLKYFMIFLADTLPTVLSFDENALL